MGSDGKSKKVFPCRGLVDSRIHGHQEPQRTSGTWHRPHQVVDPSFLLLTTPFCHPYARDILSLFTRCLRQCRKKIRQISRDFSKPRTERFWNHEHVDGEASSALKPTNYPPLTIVSIQFPRFRTPHSRYRLVCPNFSEFPRFSVE